MNVRSLRVPCVFPLRPLRSLLPLLLLLSAPLLSQSPLQPWKSIPIPPLNAFKPVEPTRITLPNGVQIFLEEDHELPFISGFVRVRGGSRDVPAD